MCPGELPRSIPRYQRLAILADAFDPNEATGAERP